MKLLYIAGWQRSGSTVVGNILGQVPGFVHTGELYYLWDYVWRENILCGCGEPFRQCPQWYAIFQSAFGGYETICAARMLALGKLAARTRNSPWILFPPSRARILARLEYYRETLSALYNGIADQTRSRVIVDSSKWPGYSWVLRSLATTDVYVLHLVRDPRAVAYSWLRRKAFTDRGRPDFMYRTPSNSSLRWAVWNLATEALWRNVDGRYLLLKYEDFMVDPAASLNRVLLFIEERGRLPFIAERQVRLETCHTVSGNPNRFETGVITLEPDDEWREKMRRRDYYTVSWVTAPVRWKYGY